MIARKQIAAEWRDSDGFWIELRSGLCDATNPGSHTIVEDNLGEAYAHDAVPCECRGCRK